MGSVRARVPGSSSACMTIEFFFATIKSLIAIVVLYCHNRNLNISVAELWVSIINDNE